MSGLSQHLLSTVARASWVDLASSTLPHALGVLSGCCARLSQGGGPFGLSTVLPTQVTWLLHGLIAQLLQSCSPTNAGPCRLTVEA